MLENKLEQCNCLTEYEKKILLNALNSAKIDAERLLIYSERGSIIVGKPTKEAREELSMLIGDYMNLKDKVDKTPICLKKAK